MKGSQGTLSQLGYYKKRKEGSYFLLRKKKKKGRSEEEGQKEGGEEGNEGRMKGQKDSLEFRKQSWNRCCLPDTPLPCSLHLLPANI